jgi:hypothetical protein
LFLFSKGETLTVRLTLLLLAAMVIVAPAAGCGGGGDSASNSSNDPTITTSSLSKDEFVKQASHACQLLRKDIFARALAYTRQRETKKAGRADETALFAAMTKAVVLPTIEKEISRIRQLGAPAGDEDKVSEFLASEQEAVDAISKLPHIASRFQIERYFAPSVKLASEYGLNECANGEQ